MDYYSVFTKLVEKYGEPTEKNTGFSEDAFTATSYLKLSAVKEGQCEYYAKWGDSDVDKMVVKLSIIGGKSMGFECALIKLQYKNVEKSKDSRKEIIDDL